MAVLTSSGINFGTSDNINSFYWMYPAGTRKLFVQSAAPTGWTKDTTHDNKSLRVVSGNGGGSGGNINFTTSFPATAKPISVPISTTPQVTSPTGQTQWSVGDTTLSVSQIPQHTHSSLCGPTGGAGANPFSNAGNRRVSGSSATGSTGGGGSHNHTFSATASVVTTGNTTMDLRVQYVDVLICSLN